MRTILVTGGAGFIGATLVPMLLARGYRVRVLDNLSVGSKQALAGSDVEWFVGDIRDRAVVEAAVENVHGIVHLAAPTSVIDSQLDPCMTSK
ncbi:MAG: NAD-dependent epimerase/dehydratase family protein [Anaerolineales bacterium]|nr:NAD-dependent epimerase/dehydratase family protein [Anaerolineales bacterium]